jgi:dipeptidyl aminopeptidase/acylaminoacyl peptidase
VSVFVAGLVHAASFEERVEALFRPPLGEMMALSPDGERVAYTAWDRGELTIVMMNVEPPGTKRTIKLEPARDAAPATEPPPMPLRFLRWATADRLIYAPAERVVPLPPVTDRNGRPAPNPDGPTILAPIFVAEADGKERGTLVDARDFQETAADARRSLADLLRTTNELAATRVESVRWRMPHLDILGFHPRDRDQLIIRTHGAYSIPMQHLVDIRTGHIREFGSDWPAPPGDPMVFDWFRLKVVGERQPMPRPTTVWRDEELGRVQRELEAKYPQRIVELIDWSDTRLRVLFRVTGGSDPGRIYVYQRPEDLVLEILRCAPWLNAAPLNPTRAFACAAPDGARLSGYLTSPGRPHAHPPALLVVFPSESAGPAQSAFDPEAQILADLGFAVARLNPRSATGAARLPADRRAADDARAAIEWLTAQHPERPFDRARIATLGRGRGGDLALRALQLEPALFRGGIAIDAPLEPDGAGATERKAVSGRAHAEAPTHPVLLLVEPGRNAAIDAATADLRTRWQGLGRAPEYFELPPRFAAATPEARAAGYRRMEEFLHQHLSHHGAPAAPGTEAP